MPSTMRLQKRVYRWKREAHFLESDKNWRLEAFFEEILVLKCVKEMAKILAFGSTIMLACIVISFCSEGCKGEKKPPNAMKLCGYDFLYFYMHCCQYPHLCKNQKRKRDVTEPSITQNHHRLLSREVAVSFLHKRGNALRRRRRAVVSSYEECCLEGCTLKELSEYKCYWLD